MLTAGVPSNEVHSVIGISAIQNMMPLTTSLHSPVNRVLACEPIYFSAIATPHVTSLYPSPLSHMLY